MPSEFKNAKDVVECTAVLLKVVYPRDRILGMNGNEFGVTYWRLKQNKKGEVKIDKKGVFTLTGRFTQPIEEKKEYTIIAKQVKNEKYGEQYELLYISTPYDFTSVYDKNKFLKSILTDLQMENLYKAYEDPFSIIASHDIEKLMAVPGIKAAKASYILKKYDANIQNSDIIVELSSYNLTQAMQNRLMETYHSPAKVIDMVKNHPYELSLEVDGIGFQRADDIAQQGGISPKSVKRVEAFICHYLRECAENNGDSYVMSVELVNDMYEYFGGSENIVEVTVDSEGKKVNNIAQAISNLQKEGTIVVEDNVNKALRRIYLTSIYNLEYRIAMELKRILQGKNVFHYDDWEERVKEVEAKQGFNFDEIQKAGIKLGLDKQVCFISGLAGSGKSSLVSGILGCLKSYTFAQCALSGKAAARLTEVTGKEGMTIHRLLGYKKGKFEFNEENQLPYDIIILDEVSLVGGEIFLDLVKAIPTGSKLIMLGDLGQLESIGMLSLAADFCNSSKIPSVELNVIHRQTAESGIISTAHDVRNQQQLFDNITEGVIKFGKSKDMVFDLFSSRDRVREVVLDWFDVMYNSSLVNKDIGRIQVISPVKYRGDSCVYNLNCDIQDYLFPDLNEDTPHIVCGFDKQKYYIYEGDKVMCIKNNYNALTEDGETTAVYNGWTGIVEKIDQENMKVFIKFALAKETTMLDIQEVEAYIVLGYASTVHKLQGSDAPVVIGALDNSTPPQMLNCQLLYTLITRAKKQCIVVGQTSSINQSIQTDSISDKRTFMCEILDKIGIN